MHTTYTEALLGYIPLVIIRELPLGHTGHLGQKATYPRSGDITVYQIHKNRNSKLEKMRQQRNMFIIEKQEKSPIEELSETEMQSTQ